MKPPRNESHDMALDLDGKPISMASGEVRAELITRLDRWQQDVKGKARRAANVRS